MCAFYSDDPCKDFDRYDAYQQAQLDKLPRCAECYEPIQDETCYEINDELICEQCLKDNHMKSTDLYVKE